MYENESMNFVSQLQVQVQVGPKIHLILGDDLGSTRVGWPEEQNALEDVIGSGLGSGEVSANKEEEFQKQENILTYLVPHSNFVIHISESTDRKIS